MRPLVHCPTQKYNSKVKLGRGFTLEELKGAGIEPKFAQTVGIAVDHRRTNKCAESLTTNVDRLKEYKEKLILFPRRLKRVKNGDSDKAATSDAQQLVGDVMPVPATASAVSFVAITEEMKAVKAYGQLREARNEKRLMGKRLKRRQEEAEANK